MSDKKKLVEFLDEQITIRKRWMSSKQEDNIAMLTEIKGIVISYPIILKALEETNENIDNFIKSEPQSEKLMVTKKEIRKFANYLFRVIPGPQERLEMEGKIEEVFKSKGFDVAEK